MESLNSLQSKLNLLGFNLNAWQIKALSTYLELLAKWNKVINLTGLKTKDQILSDLVADSLNLGQFLTTLNLDPHSQCFDLGAGAGFPSIPLRLIYKEANFTLIEIREKRALFLAQVLSKLKLPKTICYRGSFESYFLEHPKSANLIISKAFKPWEELLPLMPPLLAPKGQVIIMASEEPKAKLPDYFKLIHTHSYKLKSKERFLWLLEKA